MSVSKVLHDISERQKKLSAITDVEKNLIIDFGLMTAWDPDSVSLPKSGPKREDYFRQVARENAQEMLNKLYAMDPEVLELPEPITILPRAKSVPEPKQPTKWERFAREKNIKSNKKRDKLVWDDATRSWVPRYGYKKVKNDEQKNWLIEIPDQADPNVDYFAKRNEEKREKVAKNMVQRLRQQ